MSLADRIVNAWYAPKPTLLAAALLPLSVMFRVAVASRRALYRSGALRVQPLPVPVVVVGNITVGGSGKTPMVIALAGALAQRGWKPGIVSRGYGGATREPRPVAADSTPSQVGDEPILLARTGFPVWVGRDRPATVRALLAAHGECDVVIADDGLQHYAMARTVEIAVIDEVRGLGNRLTLPAGPLREAPSRLDEVDAVVLLRRSSATPPSPRRARESSMSLVGESFERVNARTLTAPAAAFRKAGVHAVAGIGNPSRFFEHLRSLGIDPACHPFPDHHRYAPADLAFPGASAILMTEKDAVKCVAFADDRCWMLPVQAVIDPSLVALVEEKIRGYQTA